MKRSPGQVLNIAASSGNVKIVKELLANRELILFVNSDGNSALHAAFINKHLDIVDLILEAIRSTSKFENLQNPMGLTHLHIACTRKNEQIIQSFLDAGAKMDDTIDGNSPLWTGFNALHFAARFHSLQAIKVLLKAGVNSNNKTSTEKTALELIYESLGDTLIMVDLLEEKKAFNHKRNFTNFQIACLNEDTKLVQKFIDHGAAKINSRTTHELSIASLSSPLHCAVASTSTDKIKLLLENGAQVESTNCKTMTPLHQSLYGQSVIYELENGKSIHRMYNNEMTKLLYAAVKDKMNVSEDSNGLNFFHAAIANNDLPTVKKYVNEGKVDVNKSLSNNAGRLSNYTPLHMAVRFNNVELAEFLIEHGADVNTSGKEYMTPLFMAFKYGYKKLIELFLMNGAKMDITDQNDKTTLLHLIAESINSPFYRVDIENSLDDESVIMYIEQLVKLGVSVNARNARGDTALHCFHGSANHWDTYFQMLLDLGADINLKNNRGKLPYQVTQIHLKQPNKVIAIFYHHVQKLKALGLKVDPENEETCKLIVEKGGCFGNEELMCREQQRFDEITKLKNSKIGFGTSLYNFIRLDSQRTKLYAGCKILRNIVEDVNLKKKFPSYAYLILLKYQTATELYDSNTTKKRLYGDGDGETAKKRQCFE